MNYLKIKLKSDDYIYSLRDYFPYTDKPFFKSLDDILQDEDLQLNLGYLFTQLYKDELVLEFSSIVSHKYIVPIPHASKKFNKINRIVSERIAQMLGIQLLDNYFEEINFSSVDIRDEYTKDEASIKLSINEEYRDIPVIIFDCCCSTGKIFNSIVSSNNHNKNNLCLCYGVRFNGFDLKNTAIESIEEYEFNPEPYDIKKPGYLVRIYGLFGYKNVEVDLRNHFSIGIGENGFGKSTAVKLALLALEYDNDNPNKVLLDENNKISKLSKYYFEKIEIYYSDYFYEENKYEDYTEQIIDIGTRVSSKILGLGTINKIYDNSYEVLFDDEAVGTRRISSLYLTILNKFDEDAHIKHRVRFFDADGICFHTQLVDHNGYIEKEGLDEFGLDEEKVSELANILINTSIDFNIKNYYLPYDIIKTKGTYLSALKNTIFYKDIIPSKEIMINEFQEKSLIHIINTINEQEFEKILRKILLDDRSIEVDYNELEIKYKTHFDFINFDKTLRLYFKGKIQRENKDYIEYKDFIFFNCTKSREIVSKPPRERIQLEYYSTGYYSNDENLEYTNEDIPYNYSNELDYRRIEEKAIEREEEEIQSYKINDKFAFDYDDPEEFNPYEDDLGQEDYDDYYENEDDLGQEDYDDYYENEDDDIEGFFKFTELFIQSTGLDLSYCNEDNPEFINWLYSDINNLYICALNSVYTRDIALYGFSSNNNFFDNDKIYLHKILHNHTFDCHDLTTCFYSVVNQIFKYNDFDYSNTKYLIDLKFGNTKINIDFDKFLSIENKKKISEMYDQIFNDNYNIISLGIYDVLEDSEFIKFSKIIKRLRADGLKEYKDYLLVLGIGLLIEIYKKDFVFEKNILLEKLVNKYFVNKQVIIYANNLVVVDNENNYIPIDKLSTGERNLIILFSFCLFNENKVIILDEPDLSMSVDWQSKILVDVLRFTNNSYIVISQSPLLIQKNNLSTFVCRMDFDDKLDIIEYEKLIKVIKKNNTSFYDDELPF